MTTFRRPKKLSFLPTHFSRTQNISLKLDCIWKTDSTFIRVPEKYQLKLCLERISQLPISPRSQDPPSYKDAQCFFILRINIQGPLADVNCRSQKTMSKLKYFSVATALQTNHQIARYFLFQRGGPEKERVCNLNCGSVTFTLKLRISAFQSLLMFGYQNARCFCS